MVYAQIKAVHSDMKIDACKIGLLPTKPIVEKVLDAIDDFNLKNIVLDPVLKSTSHRMLIKKSALKAMKRKLFPKIMLLTPNLYEAEVFSKTKIMSIETMKEAAKRILDLGTPLVLIKGGHLDPAKYKESVDLLYDGFKFSLFKMKRLPIGDQIRGTGCTLSSAIAANLAHGYNIKTSIQKAKGFVQQGIQRAYRHRDGFFVIDC